MKDFRKHNLPLRICKLVNLIMMSLPFILAWYKWYLVVEPEKVLLNGNWLVVFIFVILYYFIGKSYDAFEVSKSRISEMVYSQVLTVLVTDAIMYVVTALTCMELVNPLPLVFALMAQCAVAALWSIASNRWYYSTFPARRTAVIYDVRKGLDDLVEEYGYDSKFNVVKTIHVKEYLNDSSLIDGCEAVFLSGVHSKDRNVILKHCIYDGIEAYVIPRVGDVIMSSAERTHMFHLPMLRVERFNPKAEYVIAKRAFDIAVSMLAIIVLAPAMVITGLAIRTDGGPMLYRQVRLTKDGREFDVLKFRSMRVDAEKDGVARLSSGDNDDRITPVGRVIRKIRFDELPQLFNILKGDMSIVGPRPERPEIAAEYEEHMPEFKLRLQAKAGLTGYAQVYGKYNTCPYDKLQMDLMYLSKASFIEDLRICFATVKILFMPESTEGVAEGQVTAIGRLVEE